MGPDSSADSGGPRVVSLRLALADPEPGELERLEAYLQDVMGSRAGPLLVAEVSRRLDLLGHRQRKIRVRLIIGLDQDDLAPEYPALGIYLVDRKFHAAIHVYAVVRLWAG